MSPPRKRERAAERGDSADASSTYLLDTDTLSDLVRRPGGSVAERIARAGEDRVFTSLVVAGDLRYGAERSGSSALIARVDELLEHLSVAPLQVPTERRYAEVRAELAADGAPIGPNDLWIAAHALALGATVVTGNEREFRRVPGLRVENWMAR